MKRSNEDELESIPRIIVIALVVVIGILLLAAGVAEFADWVKARQAQTASQEAIP